MRHALVVGRIIRPHGLRGELSVEVRTDEPGQRYADGSVLGTDPPSAGPLTVMASRWHSGRLLVSFAEVADRNEAESLRGVWLTVDASEVTLPQDPDEFHDQQLTGLTVVTVSGELVGTVSDVLHYGQDLLSITPPAGAARRAEVLVPFVAAIAVEVDLAAGKLVIDPPPGLLDLGPGQASPAPRGTGPDPEAADPGHGGASLSPDRAGSGPGDSVTGPGATGSGPGAVGPASDDGGPGRGSRLAPGDAGPGPGGGLGGAGLGPGDGSSGRGGGLGGGGLGGGGLGGAGLGGAGHAVGDSHLSPGDASGAGHERGGANLRQDGAAAADRPGPGGRP